MPRQPRKISVTLPPEVDRAVDHGQRLVQAAVEGKRTFDAAQGNFERVLKQGKSALDEIAREASHFFARGQTCRCPASLVIETDGGTCGRCGKSLPPERR